MSHFMINNFQGLFLAESEKVEVLNLFWEAKIIYFNTRSMFRNVVAALNEALDITMHLKPLTEHFQVMFDTKICKIKNAIF